MSEDTPTVRFEQPAAPGGDDGKKKSKTLILLLSILGGVLLIAVVVLLTLLFARGLGGPAPHPDAEASTSPSASTSETPSASPSASPSETPSASPSTTPSSAPPPPPPPPSNKTAIDSFTVSPKVVYCNTSAPVTPHLYIQFTWKTTNANQIGFGVGTDDAIAAGMGWNLPPSGTSASDFPPGYTEYEFACPSASQTFTLTVSGPDGKFSKKVTVTNNGDH